jgi:hypothetical protein
MRVLLDECLPRKLKFSFPGHKCLTVPEVGLAGINNGQLLIEAERLGFQALVTIDQGFQGDYRSRIPISTELVRSQDRAYSAACEKQSPRRLLPLSQECESRLAEVRPGEVLTVGP